MSLSYSSPGRRDVLPLKVLYRLYIHSDAVSILASASYPDPVTVGIDVYRTLVLA